LHTLTKNQYELKTEFGCNWLKVFFHNSTEGIFFSSKEEARYIITEEKYSILNKINTMMKINGKYEFLLEYPTGYSNQWKQSNSPLEEKETTTSEHYNVSGYEEVNITMRDNYWGGLALSTSPYTLIEGSIGHDTWFYAIGQTTSFSNHGNQFASNVWGTCSAMLWIRIKENLISSFFNKNSRCERFTSLKFFFFNQLLS
jgi:hypothetical protein